MYTYMGSVLYTSVKPLLGCPTFQTERTTSYSPEARSRAIFCIPSGSRTPPLKQHGEFKLFHLYFIYRYMMVGSHLYPIYIDIPYLYQEMCWELGTSPSTFTGCFTPSFSMIFWLLKFSVWKVMFLPRRLERRGRKAVKTTTESVETGRFKR